MKLFIILFTPHQNHLQKKRRNFSNNIQSIFIIFYRESRMMGDYHVRFGKGQLRDNLVVYFH
jgi:hypothetical protein